MIRNSPSPVAMRGGVVGELRQLSRLADFRKLVATRLVSQAGDGAFEIGLASLFFFSPERATTAGAIAAAFAVAVLPYTVIGPFVGVLLDRWRRRQILMLVNLARSVMVLVVAVLVAVGVVGLPLYLIVLTCLSVNRFYLSGLSAGLPHVVPGEELVLANAITPTAGTVAALLGGAAAVGVRLVLGAGDRTDAVILLAAAGCYATAARLAARLHRDVLGPTPTGWRPGPAPGQPPAASSTTCARASRTCGTTARHSTRWPWSAPSGSATASSPSRRSCCAATPSPRPPTRTPVPGGSAPWRSPPVSAC